MADTLNIFGTEYTGVTGIIAKDDNSTDLTFVRPQGTVNITQSGNTDVSSYATASVASADPYVGFHNNGFFTEDNQRQWHIQPFIEVAEGEGDTAGFLADGTLINGSYYECNAVASGTSVTPTTSSQTIGGANYMMEGAVTVAAMPSGSVTAPSSITGTSATVSTGTNTLTLSKTVSVTPSVTTAGYVSSGTAGNSSVSLTASVTTQAAQTIYPSASDQTITGSKYLTGAQTIKGVTTTNLTADNIKSGVTVQIGDSADSDRVASVTGTYSGGGTSKNAQVVQSTTRTSASTLTAIGAELTVSKTGTYDIYYSCFRTNTSASYTWATRLYINGTAYGTAENTTWTNNQQNTHLSNISLTTDDKLRVYGRNTRGTSYYVCAPMLAIIEA